MYMHTCAYRMRILEEPVSWIHAILISVSVDLSLALSHTAAQAPKVFLPHETEQFVRLFKHGLVALDIYRVTSSPSGTHILRSAK